MDESGRENVNRSFINQCDLDQFVQIAAILIIVAGYFVPC